MAADLMMSQQTHPGGRDPQRQIVHRRNIYCNCTAEYEYDTATLIDLIASLSVCLPGAVWGLYGVSEGPDALGSLSGMQSFYYQFAYVIVDCSCWFTFCKSTHQPAVLCPSLSE